MKKIRKILLWAVLSCLTFGMTVNAAEEPEAGTYQQVMACDVSKYVITSQPNDAIVLNTTTALDSTKLGKAQDAIYFNLPRLKNMYYYRLDTPECMWYLTESMYPSLYLPTGMTSPANYSFVLQIVKVDSGITVASCTIEILDQLTGKTLEPTVDMSVAYAAYDGNTINLSTETRYYNPALHMYAYVTPKAMYIDKSAPDMWLNTTLKKVSTNASGFDSITGTELDLAQYEKTDGIVKREYCPTTTTVDMDLQVRPYCISSEGGLAAFSTSAYNKITGHLSRDNNAETMYALASDDELVICAKTSTPPSEQDRIAVSMRTNAYYTYDQLTGGFLTKLPDSNFKYYESRNQYYLHTTDGLTNGTFYAPDFSVLELPTTWSATGSTVSPIPDKGDKTTYTLRFDYTQGMSKTYVDVVPGEEPVLGTPTMNGYKFEGWYVDQNLTTLYDWRTFNYVVGGSYTLYAKWKPTGNYKVHFFDNKSGLDETKEFSVDEQPALPDNPSATGYLFKNWLIVDTVSSTEGTPYVPEEFRPAANRTYVFRANYDLQGIILSVTPNKKEYWIGDKIDKSTLVVLVQTDNDGTTRTLTSDEFTVSPDSITKSGDNSVTVTYLNTGAQYSFHLTGKADYLTSITAKYDGESLNVGDAIPTGAISVKLVYKSGNTVDTSEFSISPSTIRQSGTNTITVTASGYTTSITVQGNRKEGTNVNGTNTNNKTPSATNLSSITASYTGPQLYVGDNIDGGNIKVTARYSDGTTQQLNTGDFNFSPSFVRNAGTNAIDITYKDKSTKLNISATNKSSASNTGISSNKTGIGGNGAATGTGIGGTGNGTTSSNGTTVKYDENGNLIVAGISGSKDKGTSPGYLNGKNILDQLGTSASGSTSGTKVPINTVDILKEIQSAGKSANSIDITLINTAEGNFLMPDMVDALIERGMTLNVTMMNPNNQTSVVGKWTFNGKSMTAMNGYMTLNIAFGKLQKASETMYTIDIVNTTNGAGTSLSVTMQDAFVTGTFVNLYATNSEYSNSRYLQNMVWPVTNMVQLPIDRSTSFCITDRVDVYPDGSDLTIDISRTDLVNEDITQSDEANGAQTDISEPNDGQEISYSETNPAGGDLTDKDTPKPSKFPIWILLVAGGLAIVVIVGCVIAYFVLRRRIPNDEEEEYGEEDTDYSEDSNVSADYDDELIPDDGDYDGEPELYEDADESVDLSK